MRILLQCLSLASVIIFLVFVYDVDGKNLYLTIVCIIFIIFFVFYIFGGILKKTTKHRGIFHSIPATILAVLITVSVVNFFNISSVTKVILGFSVGLGYLSHLVLDEINSIVNLEGVPFIPKKSLGSAIKLFSRNKIISCITYFAIIILFWFYRSIFMEAFIDLKPFLFNN